MCDLVLDFECPGHVCSNMRARGKSEAEIKEALDLMPYWCSKMSYPGGSLPAVALEQKEVDWDRINALVYG